MITFDNRKKDLGVRWEDLTGTCATSMLGKNTNAGKAVPRSGAALQMPFYLSFDMRCANMSNSNNSNKSESNRVNVGCDCSEAIKQALAGPLYREKHGKAVRRYPWELALIG